MSFTPPSSEADPVEYDPVFLHSRREAIVIFSLWVAALFWAVLFSYFNGYAEAVDPENLRTLLGIPSWVFWGIVVPWMAADLFTIWFCLFYMADDDLGEEGAEDD